MSVALRHEDGGVSESPQFEVFPQRSLAAKRLDYVCAAILIAPLILMAVQGDLLFAVAERINYKGWYDDIREREAELLEVKQKITATEKRRHEGAVSGTMSRAELATETRRLRELETRKKTLEVAVKNLRAPLEDRADYWNLSFVKRWPLSLLLGPFFLSIVWFGVSPERRRRMVHEALEAGCRRRGILLALGAVALFWIAAWQQTALAAERVAHQGTIGYEAPWRLRYAWVLAYLSMAGWSAAAVYAFTGPRGVKRIWLPLAAIMALLIFHYGRVSASWVYQWDKSRHWSYGYFVGPIAALLLYYQFTEKFRNRAGSADSPGLLSPFALGPWPQAGLRVRGTSGSTGPGRRLWGVPVAWGLVLLVVTAAAWAVSGRTGGQRLVTRFAYVPVGLGIPLLALGVWQRVGRGRRLDVAMRLAGLVVLGAALAFRWEAERSRIHYFQEISILGVLLGGVLAVWGYRVFRVSWVAVAFTGLAVPWPERIRATLSIPPQKWAAIMTVEFADLLRTLGITDWTFYREGTTLTIGPTLEDTLTVAEQCSGLQMLFAFVALSVVYAYIAPRAAWRRVVIFLSAFPIAIVSNFVRVAGMAVFSRLGVKGITRGLEHEVAGFVIMLPLAFLLLYLEMRVLDLGKKLVDMLSEDPSTSEPPEVKADTDQRNGV